jgi:hypothetical protein
MVKVAPENPPEHNSVALETEEAGFSENAEQTYCSTRCDNPEAYHQMNTNHEILKPDIHKSIRISPPHDSKQRPSFVVNPSNSIYLKPI